METELQRFIRLFGAVRGTAIYIAKLRALSVKGSTTGLQPASLGSTPREST